jgi:uncharacterized protein (TIGR03382 family)
VRAAICVLTVLSTTSAAAESAVETSDFGAGVVLARTPVAPSTSADGPLQSRTIYAHHTGGVLSPGVDDSRADHSALVQAPTDMPGWDVDDARWAETMACLREIWSPFNIEVTDVDPQDTPHIEVWIGGTPDLIGMPANVGGISPMRLDCSVIENSVVFAFPDVLSDDPRIICEATSQEIGHSFGLDHELLPSDPMTYLPYDGERTFQDQTVACGEHTPRPCGLSGHECRADQNSVAILLDRVGPATTDHVGPALVVAEPADGAVVAPGFAVAASASDPSGAVTINLYVDGVAIATGDDRLDMTLGPDLADGRHVLVIEAIDAHANSTTAELAITVESAPDPAGSPLLTELGCSAGGQGTGALGSAFAALAFLVRRRRPASSRLV